MCHCSQLSWRVLYSYRTRVQHLYLRTETPKCCKTSKAHFPISLNNPRDHNRPLDMRGIIQVVGAHIQSPYRYHYFIAMHSMLRLKCYAREYEYPILVCSSKRSYARQNDLHGYESVNRWFDCSSGYSLPTFLSPFLSLSLHVYAHGQKASQCSI